MKTAKVVRRNSTPSSIDGNDLQAKEINNAISELNTNTSIEDDVFVKMNRYKNRVKKFLTLSWFGQLYENILLFCSVLSCIECIYQSYKMNDEHLSLSTTDRIIQLVFAMIFGFDWTLSFLLEDHKLLFLTNFYSLIDLLSVIPIILIYNQDMPNVNEIHTPYKAVIYALFAFDNIRILRLLRIRKKLAHIDDAVTRYLAEMFLSILSMILFFTACIHFVEFEAHYLPYHTWVYVIWITIATVGYGDITPATTQGRFLIMIIIGFSIIIIPKMTNELLEKMALQSVYMRAVYNPVTKRSKHILICGDVSSTSLLDFFQELFHEDHENVDLSAVLLLPLPPTTEIILLLNNSKFFTSITYLEGSPLIDMNLHRAKAESAVAVFIMTNKFSTRPDDEDAKTILLSLSIRRYISQYLNVNHKLLCMQLICPQNRKHLNTASDQSYTELVVCVNEIKMGVLAKGLLCPGANTLIMNLLSTFSESNFNYDEDDYNIILDRGEDDDDDDDDDSSNSKNKNTRHKKTSKAWLQEYEKGCDWEIYTSKLSNSFEGYKFKDLAYRLYDQIGILLFAIEVAPKNKLYGPSKLLLNPSDYRIPDQNLFLITAFVIAKNQASADLSQREHHENENGFAYLNALGRINSAASVLRRESMAPSSIRIMRSSVIMPKIAVHSKLKESSGQRVKLTGKQLWAKLKRSSLINRKIETYSYEEILLQLEDDHLSQSFHLSDKHVEMNEVMIKKSLRDEMPFIKHHIIIVYKGNINLYDLICPLRAKNLGDAKVIVLLISGDISPELWYRISMFESIYIVKGSSLEEKNFRRAGIFDACSVIVLADSSDNASSDTLVDSDAIFTYQCAKRMNSNAHVVVEIINTNNINYLNTEHIDDEKETNYKFTKQFAAGHLFTTSLLDCIICQAFYNPSVVNVMNKLLSGGHEIDHNELRKTASIKLSELESGGDLSSSSSSTTHNVTRLSMTTDSKKLNFVQKLCKTKSVNLPQKIIEGDCSRVASSCLYQMNLDNYPEYKGIKSYGKLFEALAKIGIVPIGIYRGLLTNMKFGTMANTMPYVYTNPDKDTELFSNDKIFVLSTAPIRNDGYKDVKTWLLKVQMKSKLSEKKLSPPSVNNEVVTAQNKVIERRITKVQDSVNRKLAAVIKAVEQCSQKLDALERDGSSRLMNTSRSNESFQTDYLYDTRLYSEKSPGLDSGMNRQRTESGISIDESVTSDEGGGGRGERSLSFDSNASPRYSRPVSATSQKLITIDEAYRNRRKDVKSDSDDDSEFSPDHRMTMIHIESAPRDEDYIAHSEDIPINKMIASHNDHERVRPDAKESPTVGILRKHMNDSNTDSPARARRNSSVRIVEDKMIYELQRSNIEGDGESCHESCDEAMEHVQCDEVESMLKEQEVILRSYKKRNEQDGGDDFVDKLKEDYGKYEEDLMEHDRVERIDHDNYNIDLVSIDSDTGELDTMSVDLRTRIKPDRGTDKHSGTVGTVPVLESDGSSLNRDYYIDRPAVKHLVGPSLALTKGPILNPDRMAKLRGDKTNRGPINTPTQRPNSIYPSVNLFSSAASRMRPLSASIASSMASMEDANRVHFIRPASANDLTSRGEVDL